MSGLKTAGDVGTLTARLLSRDRKRSPGNYARENVQLSYFPSVGALEEKKTKKREREINREIIIHKRLSVVSFLSLQKAKK